MRGSFVMHALTFFTRTTLVRPSPPRRRRRGERRRHSQSLQGDAAGVSCKSVRCASKALRGQRASLSPVCRRRRRRVLLRPGGGRHGASLALPVRGARRRRTRDASARLPPSALRGADGTRRAIRRLGAATQRRRQPEGGGGAAAGRPDGFGAAFQSMFGSSRQSLRTIERTEWTSK